MSTAFETPGWSTTTFSSSPSSSRSSSNNSSPSTSPPGSNGIGGGGGAGGGSVGGGDGNKFNWMDAIAQLQEKVTEEAKVKRKYAIYTIKEETKDELIRYKMK
jgi:hypothetical protein